MSSLIYQRLQGFFVVLSNIVITDVSPTVTSPLQFLSLKNKVTPYSISLYVQILAAALSKQLHSCPILCSFPYLGLYSI